MDNNIQNLKIGDKVWVNFGYSTIKGVYVGDGCADTSHGILRLGGLAHEWYPRKGGYLSRLLKRYL